MHPQNIVVCFPLLARRFVQPDSEVGQTLFAFRLDLHVDRLASEAFLIRRLRVAGDLFQVGMTRNGFDLFNRATRVRQPCRRRLAQPMERTMRQACGVALSSEPVAETVRIERRTERRHQERQVRLRHGGQDRNQVRVHGDQQRRSGLLLPHVNAVAFNMLPAHAQHVAFSLPGVEAKRERQPGA